jgi:ornithine cyclodeaminase/alanine dehydrogenase-like protein (mu-crystallin family)
MTDLLGARIDKPPLDVLVLSEAQVRAALDLDALLDGLDEGFADLAAGRVTAPARPQVTQPDGSFLLCMSGRRGDGPIVVKVVTVFDGNQAHGLPSHLATISIYDGATGACLAFMDGTYITAVRTSGAAAVSARRLARADARVLTLVGAGVQAHHHLELFPRVREFEEILIASEHYIDAQALAARHSLARATDDLEAAVRRSDVVALATHAAEPVIEADWVRPGTHVSSVGYAPPRGELPVELLDRARLFVETGEAFEPVPVGCAELAGRDPASATELGAAGSGRRDADEITVYKAMGHVMEDIVAAELVYAAAAGGATITL